MSVPAVEQTVTETVETEPSADPQAGAEQTAEQATPEVEPEPKLYDESYVRRLREENASWRTKLREAEEAGKTAAKALEDVSSENLTLRRENVAKDHKLPPEIAALLQGTTVEELEAHAAQLAPLVRGSDFPPPPTTSGGGLNGSTAGEGTSDPGELAARLARPRIF